MNTDRIPDTLLSSRRTRGCRPGLIFLLAIAFGCRASLPAHADPIADKSDMFVKARCAAARTSAVARVGGGAQQLTHAIVRLEDPLAGSEPGATALAGAEASADFVQDRSGAYEAQLRGIGAVVYSRLPLIHSLAITIPTARMSALAQLSFVRRISEDVVTRKHDEFTVESSGADIARQQYGVTGNGATIAVIDSGIRRHRDLSVFWTPRILANVSFVPNDPRTDDLCGHGTHVAGIAAGNGDASSGSTCFRTFMGIAPRSSLVNVRVLDANGQGMVSTVISGLQWCIDHKGLYNIRVINLSLGHPVGESYVTDPLCQAVEQAWKSGIVVVCAAGNDGRLSAAQTAGQDNEGWGTAYNSINVPANDPCVITVGCMKSTNGVRSHDTISTYSGRGPTTIDSVLKPDIVAPGNQVISLRSTGSILDQTYGGTNIIPISTYKSGDRSSESPQYFRLSGTSMAAPVVSGAALLLLEADPTLTPDTVKARLMITADKWCFANGMADPCTFGAGYLNIPAALRSTTVATKAAQSPALVGDRTGNVFIDRIVWGDQIIWGTPINDLSIIWGRQVVSGKNTVSNTNVTWEVQGSQIIWGGDGTSAGTTADSIDSLSISGDE